MAQSSLIWRLKTSFNFFCNEVDNTRAMMDEVMVSRRTLSLLLQSIFFMMQNVGIIFETIMPNCGTQHKTRQQNSPTTKTNAL
jgi:hypothetical protein